MKSAAFEYTRPHDVSGALALLAEGGDDAKPIAGGQSLGPMLNLRLAQPALVVDLRHVDELKAVTESAEAVVFGACVTHAAIEDGRVPDPTNGYLRRVAANIAYRAVRNRGTIGGSLSHADPAADWPSALMAVGARVVIASMAGRREVPLEAFITGIFETALGPGEVLVSVRVPRLGPGARTGYWKFCRKAGEFAQAIGAVLHDPARDVARAVVGATQGAPFLIGDARALIRDPSREAVAAAVARADLGDDAYSRQLHAVALRHAIEGLRT